MDEKFWLEAGFNLLSGLIGAFAGVFLGMFLQSRKENKDQQISREVWLHSCLIVTLSNRVVLKNDGLNHDGKTDVLQERLNKANILIWTHKLEKGLTTDQYSSFLNTGLQSSLGFGLRDQLLYCRGKIVALKAILAASYDSVIHLAQFDYWKPNEEWKWVLDNLEDTNKELGKLETYIEQYLIANGWFKDTPDHDRWKKKIK